VFEKSNLSQIQQTPAGNKRDVILSKVIIIWKLKFRFLAQVEFTLHQIIFGVSEHESFSLDGFLSI